MKKALLALGLSLLLALSLASPASGAKKAEAATVATGAGYIVIFKHDQFREHIYIKDLVYKCAAGTPSQEQTWSLFGNSAGGQASSIRLDGGAGWGCNSIGVQSRAGYWYWACTDRYGRVISNFGSSPANGFYNDNLQAFGVRVQAGCPAFV